MGLRQPIDSCEAVTPLSSREPSPTATSPHDSDEAPRFRPLAMGRQGICHFPHRLRRPNKAYDVLKLLYGPIHSFPTACTGETMSHGRFLAAGHLLRFGTRKGGLFHSEC